ncbi:MAG TPA: ParB/RepB/Spo0J family partition protein [Bacteroidales bacterium]|jgi:ParB family chromosome partitioning protein|nr:ParB/RepB/Spo0J family partition protein [Bacteroidales bacterium]OQC57662.1 MAG: Chromosome-partitioning protein Spo0J [Bacteroidetes bacterium ADurb.Bin013]MBP8998759.1 ParB/RepB/Spo0J family partition protein [Bacteroidales bacterium]MBV6455332.1 Nucleoid occlusion protein [Bacteroidales bacterium]MCZ2316252.1 ParB/RepB/Spo0J family partition protein [Bacteroidales bacterium]
MTKKPALGKGLGALISETPSLSDWKPRNPVVLPQVEGTSVIDIDLIEVNPEQPRKEFNGEALAELAASIRNLGLIQPLTLRKLAVGKYQLVSGERRLRAARMAGLTKVPAYIRQVEDNALLEMALVENIQREDLDAMEIAYGFQRLTEECDLTQEQLAERVGKKRATVANYLRLIQLPAQIQLFIRAGALTMGHARALLSLEEQDARLALAKKIVEKGLSVRQVEAMVRPAGPEKNETQAREAELPDVYYRVLERIGTYFNNNISLKRNARGEGVLTVYCSSDSEMEAFLEALEKNNI